MVFNFKISWHKALNLITMGHIRSPMENPISASRPVDSAHKLEVLALVCLALRLHRFANEVE